MANQYYEGYNPFTVAVSNAQNNKNAIVHDGRGGKGTPTITTTSSAKLSPDAIRAQATSMNSSQAQYNATGTNVTPTSKGGSGTGDGGGGEDTPPANIPPSAPATVTSNAADIYKSYLDSVLADYQAQMQARQEALERQYQDSLGRLKESYDNSRTNMQNQSEDALRQSYINYMLGQRDVNQRLANQGVNGGMAESTLAEMYNNYGNSRNAIARNLNDNLSELASIYNNNVASLGNTYGSNIADVLSDYYDKATSAKASYASQIANALGKQATANASTGGTSTKEEDPYKAYVSSVGAMAKNGNSYAAIKEYLNRNGILDDATVENIINQAGYSKALLDPTSVQIGANIKPSGYNKNTALNDLRKIRSQASTESELQQAMDNYLNKLVQTYGISDTEAMELARQIVG